MPQKSSVGPTVAESTEKCTQVPDEPEFSPGRASLPASRGEDGLSRSFALPKRVARDRSKYIIALPCSAINHHETGLTGPRVPAREPLPAA